MVFLAHNDQIQYEEMTHEKIPAAFQGFRLFLIADIHRRRLRQHTIEKLAHPPDIVCIAGDLIERGVPLERMRDNIKILKQWKVPVYFVWGNNDYEAQPDEIIRILKEEDVIILEDDMQVIERNHAHINVLGLDFYFDHMDETILGDWSIPKDTFTILLAHKPHAFMLLDKTSKTLIDLVLSGHTHGGQIRIFGFGPYTKGGKSKFKDTILLTTEGYGYTLFPFRLGTRSECHLLTLNSLHRGQ